MLAARPRVDELAKICARPIEIGSSQIKLLGDRAPLGIVENALVSHPRGVQLQQTLHRWRESVHAVSLVGGVGKECWQLWHLQRHDLADLDPLEAHLERLRHGWGTAG